MLVCLCVEGLKWKSPPGGSNAVEKVSGGLSMAASPWQVEEPAIADGPNHSCKKIAQKVRRTVAGTCRPDP